MEGKKSFVKAKEPQHMAFQGDSGKSRSPDIKEVVNHLYNVFLERNAKLKFAARNQPFYGIVVIEHDIGPTLDVLFEYGKTGKLSPWLNFSS